MISDGGDECGPPEGVAARIPAGDVAAALTLAGLALPTHGAAAAEPCRPQGTPVEGLLICRNCVTFEPHRPFLPGSVEPTEDQLHASLSQLYAEGWRGLVTSTMDGIPPEVPRLASASTRPIQSC